MLSLFLFGTLWFWILVAVELVIIVTSLEQEYTNSLGWFSFVVFLCLLYFFGNSTSFNGFFQYITHNPTSIIPYFISYVVIGVFWSLYKWYLYVKDKAAPYYPENGTTHYGISDTYFNAGKNKERIINWMMYWPISGLWFLINQSIKRFFQYIYNSIINQYQNIGDKIYKDVMEKRNNAEDLKNTKSK